MFRPARRASTRLRPPRRVRRCGSQPHHVRHRYRRSAPLAQIITNDGFCPRDFPVRPCHFGQVGAQGGDGGDLVFQVFRDPGLYGCRENPGRGKVAGAKVRLGCDGGGVIPVLGTGGQVVGGSIGGDRSRDGDLGGVVVEVGVGYFVVVIGRGCRGHWRDGGRDDECLSDPGWRAQGVGDVGEEEVAGYGSPSDGWG